MSDVNTRSPLAPQLGAYATPERPAFQSTDFNYPLLAFDNALPDFLAHAFEVGIWVSNKLSCPLR
jgi:hypothetical protein